MSMEAFLLPLSDELGSQIRLDFDFKKNKFGVLRNTYYVCDMKEMEKRNPHSYKVADRYYERAQKKAAKTDKTLTERIEEFVIDYGRRKRKISRKK